VYVIAHGRAAARKPRSRLGGTDWRRPVTCKHCRILGRFLSDLLQGDTYFKISRPNHNLDRTRAQLALLRSLEAQAGEWTGQSACFA
jgi:hypothetical protein